MNEEIRKRKFPLRRAMIIAGVAIAVIIVAAAAFGRGHAGEDSQEADQTTAQAEVMNIENTLSTDGEVVSSLEEDLSPHTSYYLDEIKVEAGDALEEGDTILTYTNGAKMTAPYNCVVKSWDLPDEEEQLTTDHSVTVAGTDVLRMQLDVGEDQVALVKAGEEASVTVDATESSFDGVVTSVSEQGDYSSSGSTFTAQVTFDNDGSVKLGMSGTASITLAKAEDALCVPVSAVTTSGNESKVTVQKEDGSTEEVTVTTGIKNDAYVQITDGLSEGETVIVPVSDNESEDSHGGFMNGPGGNFGGDRGGSGDGGMHGGGQPPGQNQ
ncbi:MAG: HlyD family efflux transporter periplasmic adaptor subunit [Firmicutes bacterium]|nr:HlyD family efflux transporter periplasmic adaptor subunit [Bacillota bacterium]